MKNSEKTNGSILRKTINRLTNERTSERTNERSQVKL